MADGQYKFSISLDDSQFEADIKRASSQFKKLVKAAKKAGYDIDESLTNPFEKIKLPNSLPQQTNEVAKSFNGLGVATQQIVRELPAATIGLNTFFLAVSNNLPILADQIKQVNEENKRLAEEGKPTVSVLKQIGKSLISWQTLLTVGITLLTMYGKDIVNWVGSLFKSKKGIDALKEAQEGLNNAIKENGLGIGDEIVKYKELGEAYNKLGEDMAAKKQFIIDNKDAFHDLGVEVQNVADADKLFIDQTDDFVEALKKRAQAEAARKLAEQKYEEAMLKEHEAKQAETEGPSWWDKSRSSMSYISTTGTGPAAGSNQGAQMQQTAEELHRQRIAEMRLEAQKTASEADAYFDMMTKYEQDATEILEKAGLTPATQDNEAELRAEEQRLKQLTDARIRLMNDARRATTEAELAAMQEGLAKKLAQIDYEYDEEERKIAEREQQLKALNGGQLSDSDAANIAAMRSANTQNRNTAKNAAWDAELAWGADVDKEMADATEALKAELNKRNKAWEDYALEFGTFQERLLATQRRYDRLIAEADTEGERMALEAERDALLAQYEVETSAWAQELVGMTTQQLNKMVDELQAQVDAKQTAFDALDSSNSKEAKDYQKTINELNAKIKKLKELLGDAQGSAGDDSWAESVQVFQNISNAANDAAEGIAEFDEGLADALRGIAQLSGSAINMIGAIQGVTKAFAAGASTIEKASAILAVVGAAIQAVTTLISLFKGSDEVEQTMRQFKELNTELEHFRKLAQIDSVEGTIFGEDAYGNFANNLKVMREASEELKTTQSSFGNIYESQMAYFEKLLAQYQTTGDTVGEKVIQGKIDELKAQGKSYQAVLGSFIVGGSEGQTLADLYPELFAGGEVTLEGLQNLKNSDVWEKLSQKNRDLIDELIADWERYDEATNAVTDYLKDIFGELGNDINDAIVDAFANGTDAAEAFGDVAGKVMENLISQIGYTAYIAPILSKAMEDVKALNGGKDLSAEEYLNALMGIVGETMKAAEGAVENYNEFLELSDKKAEEQGLNTFNGERTAPSKGIAQASQDSVDELNGRMTAIQGHTYSLVNGQRQLINDSAQMLRHLAGIESNTAELKQMRTDMSAMRKDISDMATRGIITR